MMLLTDMLQYFTAQNTTDKTEYGLTLSLFSPYTVRILRIATPSALRIQLAIFFAVQTFEKVYFQYQ